MLWLRILKLLKIISKKRFDDLVDIHTIKRKNLFNTKYYLHHNPDVKKSKINPAKHYLNYGWKEGRNPSKKFDNNAYLRQYPDIINANICPLMHYIKFGVHEGRIARTVSGERLICNCTLKQTIKYLLNYPIRVHDEYQYLKDKIKQLKNIK